jgi:hypothetical protein
MPMAQVELVQTPVPLATAQTLLQPPQLLELLVVSTHWPLHRTSGAVQVV